MSETLAKDLVPFQELPFLLRQYGVRRSESLLYRWASGGIFPTLKIGKYRFVDTNHIPAIAEYIATPPKIGRPRKDRKDGANRPAFENFISSAASAGQ